MNAAIKTPKGTHDIFGQELRRHKLIEAISSQLSQSYGYSGIETPVFEFVEVFSKSLGSDTDIIGKEMYVFQDKGGETLSLRPEGTAPVVRAVVSNAIPTPAKLYYFAPMFRRERPQKGRYRQFHQFGIESLGSAFGWPDVEGIRLAAQILKALGVQSKLLINLIGDEITQQKFARAIKDSLLPRAHELSEASQSRLLSNPLRILDSKDPGDQSLLDEIPSLESFYSDETKAKVDFLRSTLTKFGIEFEWSSRLVRGLDYYSDTVFEFVSDQLGAQSTVLAGGRYDKLFQRFGSKVEVPSFGWGMGVERISLIASQHLDQLLQKNQKIQVALISSNSNLHNPDLIALIKSLERLDICVHFDFGEKSLAKKLKKASESNWDFAMIAEERDLLNKQALLKNLKQRTQTELPLDVALEPSRLERALFS